jgi:hypothetical protein
MIWSLYGVSMQRSLTGLSSGSMWSWSPTSLSASWEVKVTSVAHWRTNDQQQALRRQTDCYSCYPIFYRTSMTILKCLLLLPWKKKTPWSESASELYRPSDRRLSAKWLPTFADTGCHVVSVTDPYGRILVFLDRRRYFSIICSSTILYYL